MTTKELIELLKQFPEDEEVVMEKSGTALYTKIGKPSLRKLHTVGGYNDCVCIGEDITNLF